MLTSLASSVQARPAYRSCMQCCREHGRAWPCIRKLDGCQQSGANLLSRHRHARTFDQQSLPGHQQQRSPNGPRSIESRHPIKSRRPTGKFLSARRGHSPMSIECQGCANTIGWVDLFELDDGCRSMPKLPQINRLIPEVDVAACWAADPQTNPSEALSTDTAWQEQQRSLLQPPSWGTDLRTIQQSETRAAGKFDA